MKCCSPNTQEFSKSFFKKVLGLFPPSAERLTAPHAPAAHKDCSAGSFPAHLTPKSDTVWEFTGAMRKPLSQVTPPSTRLADHVNRIAIIGNPNKGMGFMLHPKDGDSHDSQASVTPPRYRRRASSTQPVAGLHWLHSPDLDIFRSEFWQRLLYKYGLAQIKFGFHGKTAPFMTKFANRYGSRALSRLFADIFSTALVELFQRNTYLHLYFTHLWRK